MLVIIAVMVKGTYEPSALATMPSTSRLRRSMLVLGMGSCGSIPDASRIAAASRPVVFFPSRSVLRTLPV